MPRRWMESQLEYYYDKTNLNQILKTQYFCASTVNLILTYCFTYTLKLMKLMNIKCQFIY